MVEDLRNNVRKVSYILIGLLVAVFIYVSYIQMFESEFLSGHPLNRRYFEAAAKVERGRIIDRNGEVLAYSETDSEGKFQRYYPYGAILAHPIGYLSTKYGTTGLEGEFNGYLSGMINPQRRLGPIANLWSAKAGSTVVLTLDASLQKRAYQALGSRRGAIIVLNTRTGEILAMVSKPAFDPAQIDNEWDTVANAQDSPLLNRTIQGLYPPGSTLKVLVADAALAEKITDFKKIYNCNGALKIGSDYELHESNNKAHGKVNLEEALTVSCNVTFGKLSLELGRNGMAKAFDRYGFMKPLGSELQETASRLPDFSNLSDGDLAQTGIGQASLLVTPLRMAMVAAAIANNGVIMNPHIVSRVTAPDGSIITEYAASQFIEATSADRANAVARMMTSVVNEGTGYGAKISGIQVAGKTGTAENPHGEPHAWFIGFAPADNPEIAIAVIVENGGSGGAVAAPIAGQIFNAVLR